MKEEEVEEKAVVGQQMNTWISFYQYLLRQEYNVS